MVATTFGLLGFQGLKNLAMGSLKHAFSSGVLLVCGGPFAYQFLLIFCGSALPPCGALPCLGCPKRVSMTRRAYILYGHRVIRCQGGASFNLALNGRFE